MTATTPETTVETLPYKNPDLPASERIADLLSRMTLEEKVGQMMQLDARGGDLDELIDALTLAEQTARIERQSAGEV